MGTYFRRPNSTFGSVSSRLVTVITTDATKVILSSGFTAMNVFNVGATTIAWGGSNLLAASGGLLFYSMQQEFPNIQSDGEIFFISDSANGRIMVNEFRQ